MSRSPKGGVPQTAFIIMPFATEFDDVYDVVKGSVASVDQSMKVIRLDEIRAAGSITEDLVAEIRKSTLCIADVTDANPNVMWEVGFAAALGKPIIAISQGSDKLPFDVKDVRTLAYSRTSLSKTLRDPLTAAVKETLERYVARRSGLTVEQQTPSLRTIAVTGSMAVPRAVVGNRVEQLLRPYLGSNYHWYTGSYGTTDEAILAYLLDSGEESVTVVGHTSFDISDQVLPMLEQHPHVAFVDAEREQVPRIPGSSSKRDTLFVYRADLIIVIWNGKSTRTDALMQWLSDIRKDHVVGFISPR